MCRGHGGRKQELNLAGEISGIFMYCFTVGA